MTTRPKTCAVGLGTRTFDTLLTQLAAFSPSGTFAGWTREVLNGAKTDEVDDRVLLAVRRKRTQGSSFDWRYALDSVLNRLDRLKPEKLFSRKREEQMSWAVPEGGFMELPQNKELILGCLTKTEFLKALVREQVLPSGLKLEVTTNQEQDKIGRAITVKDRDSNNILLSLRGHLGSWVFESPLDEERMHSTAYLIDQFFLADEARLSKLPWLFTSSLSSDMEAFVALPKSFDEARRFQMAGFKFLNPIASGRFLALSRDLRGTEISKLLEGGSVLLMPDKKVFNWKVKEMIFSQNPQWKAYFSHPRFVKMRESAHNLHHFKTLDG